MKKLVLATANRDKAAEHQSLLKDLPVEVLTIEDFPGLIMPSEDRPTFAGNAVKKAEAVSRAAGEMALADDSGLEVEALGGRPGVYSARYAGPEGDYRANNRLLLEELKGVVPEERKARFVCAIALALPGRKTLIVEESCPGWIAPEPRGEGGFGYDSLFVYEPAGVTFAQMSAADKNRVSHRGRALRRARDLLEQLLAVGPE